MPFVNVLLVFYTLCVLLTIILIQCDTKRAYKVGAVVAVLCMSPYIVHCLALV